MSDALAIDSEGVMTDFSLKHRFYRHTNEGKDIGWKTSDDRIKGPILKKTLNILERDGLMYRGEMYDQEGGWSGDLYVVHRRLFSFQDEGSMGGGSVPGDKRAQVYEVVMNSTSGWAQYLSVLLRGDFKPEIAQKFESLDFAPKHSYLAKNDPVPGTSSSDRLWLDMFREFLL